MRRQGLTFNRAFAAAFSCLVVACGLDVGGLEVAEDASTVSTPTSALDGAITIVPDGSGSSMSSSTSTDPSAGDSAVEEPDPQSIPDAAAIPDVAIIVDLDSSDSDAAALCDRDQDGFLSNSAECGGTDCCDFDSRAFPGQSTFFTSADACGSFDYNCNGKNDTEFGKVDCQLGVLSCSGSGFEATPPGCGDTATFDECDFFLLCYTSQEQKVEACR